MTRPQPIQFFRGILGLVILSISSAALGAEEAPCGVLENFEGVIRILDASKSKLIPIVQKQSISCGDWVSIEDGWAQFSHRDGADIRLGANSFIQFLNPQVEPKDQLTLFRGQVYVSVAEDSGEFRVISEAGRARIKRGKAIVISTESESQTQLVALQNTSTLENRLEPSGKIEVHAGETSFLNMKFVRVLPLTPEAISVAALKPRLFELKVPDPVQTVAIQAALQRKDRNFAAVPKNSSQSGGRSLASKPGAITYLRNSSSPETPRLREHLFKKMVGGAEVTRDILHPDAFYGKSQKLNVEVEDADSQESAEHPKTFSAEELKEKLRLIEELSRIRVE